MWMKLYHCADRTDSMSELEISVQCKEWRLAEKSAIIFKVT